MSVDRQDAKGGGMFDARRDKRGEALYRFLLEQAATPPTFRIKCQGTHEDTASNPDGSSSTRTAVDFRFYLQPRLLHEDVPPPIFIVGDRSATFRGRSVKEIEIAATADHRKDPERGEGSGTTWRRKASKPERAATAERDKLLTERGLPPWGLMTGENPRVQACIDSEESRRRHQATAPGPPSLQFEDNSPSAPTKSLHQWADDYCKSTKSLKEFKFHKVIYGWDLENLRRKIHRTLEENWDTKDIWRPEITVTFEVLEADVSIRSDSWLSWMLARTWGKILLCILLLYPLLLWLFGGEWRVAGSAYSLARWVHLEDSIPGDDAETYCHRMNDVSIHHSDLKSTPRGVSMLMGVSEEAWFREWEGRIAGYCRSGVNMPASAAAIDAPGPSKVSPTYVIQQP
ncbi:hypothetical protein FRB98_002039 [Tulasnella sp. 332]|nr:hypothetical protein FRB98_002039 [Tulasnella sp. 332]